MLPTVGHGGWLIEHVSLYSSLNLPTRIPMPTVSQRVLVPDDLPSAKSAERAAIHQAALEWSILAPIIIRTQDDVKSRVRWADGLEPFLHQYENLFTFCRRLPVSLIADDVGLGKTVSAGLILSELMMRQRVQRTLVLCPKILCAQWESELRTKFGIAAHACTGSDNLRTAIHADHPVVITTNHSALSVLPTLKNDQFEMLILDEAHKLRNLHGTGNPPQIATRVRDAIQKRLFSFTLMLTATPLHNRLWDIYSLIDLLSLGRNHANPFGTPSEFKKRFIDTKIPGDRVLQKGRKDEFRGIVRDYMVRTRRLDAKLPFPKREVETPRLTLTRGEAKLFELVGDVIGDVGGLEQVSLAKALLSSPQALAAQLRNMVRTRPHFQKLTEAVGAFADGNPVTAKLAYLSELTATLTKKAGTDWRLLIFTERAETQRALGQWLEAKGIRHRFISGGQPLANREAIDALQADPPQVNCVVSTDAGAEGVNLQACNYVVNFDLPWNPMTVEQRIGRVQRLASKHEHVVVTNLVLDHPADAHIVGLLLEKLMAIANAVDDIESVLEDMSPDGEADGESFARKIQSLVVKALKKQDTTAAIAKIKKNIEDAAKRKKDEEGVLDETFGGPKDAAHPDLRPPDLSYPDPSLGIMEFVLGAKRLEGSVVADGQRSYVHTPVSGLPEQFTFDKAIADSSHGTFGRRHEYYDAGTPPFQRLVGRWATDHHVVEDRTLGTPEALVDAMRSLLQKRPWIQATAAEVIERHNTLDVAVVVRAQASNGVDRYEKLIRVGKAAAGQPVASRTFPVKPARVHKEELPPELGASVEAAVNDDEDICSFLEYYDEKRRSEVQRAGQDATRLSRIAANYTNRLMSKVVAAEGIHHTTATLRVRYTIDGKGDYASHFTIDTLGWRISAGPELVHCDVSDRPIPVDASGRCSVTGTVACRHFLARSGVSERFVVLEKAVTCEATGITLLPDEAGESDYSRRTVDRRLLKKSDMSERLGLADEMTTCGFTHASVLLDELVPSAISGKPIRRDEAVDLGEGRFAHHSELSRCEVTGRQLPPELLGTSDYSGKTVERTLLTASAIPPHRQGIEAELVTCSISGLRVLEDEIVRSAVSGKPCLPELAARSDRSGSAGLPEEMVVCSLSGRTLLPGETVRSDISSTVIEIGHEVRSAFSGRIGTPAEATSCELTGSVVLRDEIAPSDVSDKMYRSDQKVILSDGRSCHESEARECDLTGDLISLADGEASHVSGKWVRRDLLVPSEKSPERLGLDSETVVCAITGKRLLADEVTQVESGGWGDSTLVRDSEISGKKVFPKELVPCEESGKLALPAELETCEASGKRVDPALLVRSPVSARKALPAALVLCEITGDSVLPDELATSDISGKRFRHDHAATLADGRVAHRSETRPCEATGRVLARNQGAASDLSGKWVDTTILIPSDKSGRRGLPEELRRCSVTGQMLLDDELARSASGKEGDKDLLTRSGISGRPAFAVELVTCASSGVRGLPDEMEPSALSGKLIDKSILEPSPISGRRGAQEDFMQCECTGTRVLSDELATSDVSGKRYRKDQQATDYRLRTGHSSEFGRCGRSKKLFPRNELQKSDVSGIEVDETLLVASEKTLVRKGLPEELVTCCATGKRLLSDEVARSEVSGQLGDRDRLFPSPRLKKMVFETDLVSCPVSGVRLLSEEMEPSDVSGKRVAPECLQKSGISDRRGLADEFGVCDFTGARCLTIELAKSDISGRTYRMDEQLLGDDGRRGHRSEFRVCAHSGRALLPSQGDISAVSGKWAAHDCLVASEVSPTRRGLPSESLRCAFSGKLILTDESDTSDISGRRGCRTLLVRSPVSHEMGFPDEMHQCPETKSWFRPEELEECSITNQHVDARLLGRSDLSYKRALQRLLVPCAFSGRLVLPTEMETCEVTGQRVLPEYLGTCVSSGKTTLKKLLVRCDLPVGWVADTDTCRTRSAKSGRVCAGSLAKRCAWSDATLLPDEGQTCALTQLWFDSSQIMNDEFALLRRCFGKTPARSAMSDCNHLVPWIDSLITSHGVSIRSARGIPSPDKRRLLVVADIARWPWQPERWLVLLADSLGERHFGRGVVFSPQKGGWTPTGFIEGSSSTSPSK